ncbi:MAG TPA: hypothetical protein VJ835_02390 [Fimbriimonadaceae bacterium]|nr:hypothetical protein [Fimbriimonadaceae bacterium]
MNMKLLAIAAATAVFGLAISQQAGPQGGGFGPPQGPGQHGFGPGGPGMGPGILQGPRLLMNPSVQKELNLTNEQREQTARLMPQRGPGGPGDRPGFGGPGGPPNGGQGGNRGGQGGPPNGGGQGGNRGGQGGPPNGGGPGFGPPQGGPPNGGPGFMRNDRQGQEMEKKIQEILNDSQYRRYQEISLQQQGAMAILRPDISEKLGITDDQRQELHEIMMSNRPPMPGPGEGQRMDPEQMHNMMMKHQEELNAKILAVLTGQQRSKWNSMLGKPFKIEHPQGRPGFGGPGGPGGRGDGGRGGQGGGG